jgi:hypothetical protein
LKTLKGKEMPNQALITTENAEGRGTSVPFFFLLRFPRLPRFISMLNTNLSFIQIQNLINDILWNRYTSLQIVKVYPFTENKAESLHALAVG